jgi:hypothetical protein
VGHGPTGAAGTAAPSSTHGSGRPMHG